MTLPPDMTLIKITQPGDPEVLQPSQAPVPIAGAGEVLIRVLAAGVNRPDVIQSADKYPMKPGMSPIPGLEVAGEVVGVGEGVSDFCRGRQGVCADQWRQLHRPSCTITLMCVAHRLANR